MTFACILPMRNWWRGLFGYRWTYDDRSVRMFPALRHLDQLTIFELWMLKHHLTLAYARGGLCPWRFGRLFYFVDRTEQRFRAADIDVVSALLFYCDSLRDMRQILRRRGGQRHGQR